MTKLADTFAAKAKDIPLFSLATTLAAPATILSSFTIPENPYTFTALAIVAGISPLAMGIAGLQGGFNCFRERSTLSKLFSGAAAATAAAGTVGFATTVMNQSDWGFLSAFAYSIVGMSTASALNVASHYTRSIGKAKPDNTTAP